MTNLSPNGPEAGFQYLVSDLPPLEKLPEPSLCYLSYWFYHSSASGPF